MVGGRHAKASAEIPEVACPEHTCEAGVSVGDNGLGKTIAPENILEKYQGELGGRAGGLTRDEDSGLAETINEDGDGILARLGLG